jgi:hypothetical protein
MRMRSSHAARRIVRVAPALGAIALSLSAACSEGGRDYSPTAPAVSTAPPFTAWSGTWTVDEVTPAGDCLADALTAYFDGSSGWPFELELERGSSSVGMRFKFGSGNGDNEGFWPTEYEGSLAANGVISGSLASSRIGSSRTDPWLELCYWEWTVQSGELSAILSADGTHLTGTITETFRVVSNGTTFTVRSHFTADYN